MRFGLLPFVVSLFAIPLSGCCFGVLCEPCMSPGIYVRVVDAATEQPIEDATVTVAGGAECPTPSVSSPSEHHCDVPSGEHTLEVSAPGYVAKLVPATLPASDADGCCSCDPFLHVNVTLDPM